MNKQLLHKIDVETTKAEKKIKKVRKQYALKAKLLAIGIGILLFLFVFSVAFYQVSKWYDSYSVRFQSPVIIRPLFLIEKRKPVKIKVPVVVTPTPPFRKEGNEIVPNRPQSYEKAYDLVWLHESGRGTNTKGLNGYCLSKGLINEIVFAPHENYCFSDRVEQKETFMTWLDNRLNKRKQPFCNTIGECLLVYSNNGYTF